MEKFLSLYSGFADWKRRWILIAFLLCLGGIVWEINDLLQENDQHPWIKPGSELTSMKFDEYGDPYAIAKPESLPYAKIWSNPLTRVSFVFILTLIIGSLIRGLTRGVIALVVLIVFTVLMFGQSSLSNYEFGSNGVSFKDLFSVLAQHSNSIKSFVLSYLEIVGVAVVGLYFGIFK